jgi:hypothetical protein
MVIMRRVAVFGIVSTRGSYVLGLLDLDVPTSSTATSTVRELCELTFVAVFDRLLRHVLDMDAGSVDDVVGKPSLLLTPVALQTGKCAILLLGQDQKPRASGVDDGRTSDWSGWGFLFRRSLPRADSWKAGQLPWMAEFGSGGA